METIMKKAIWILGGLLILSCGAAAFNGHVVTEGPLTVTIGEVEGISQYDTPYPVMVSVKNSGGEAIAVTLEVRDLVDEFICVGAAATTRGWFARPR